MSRYDIFPHWFYLAGMVLVSSWLWYDLLEWIRLRRTWAHAHWCRMAWNRFAYDVDLTGSPVRRKGANG